MHQSGGKKILGLPSETANILQFFAFKNGNFMRFDIRDYLIAILLLQEILYIYT